ncbi:uncharacterized protein L201_003506 [Kwoniella dendrophila CBS 6074]|uniref:Uncharacterized protein n=1 Tax=Kwoniella dendrophila CBS 6074 TaxID=1295534 RepID=A0AAX4JUI9_9TREE
MASMDDLMATFSHDLRAGPQGNDLRDLHAKLAQTLNNPIPYQQHRPIPPPAISTTSSGYGGGNGVPLPPPAPASSWNTPPPGTGFLFSSSPQPKSFSKGFVLPSPSSSSSNNNNNNQNGGGVPYPQFNNTSGNNSYKKESGFAPIPFPTTIPERAENLEQLDEGEDMDRPYHTSVLPVKASPKETTGFVEDAFRPIWDDKQKDQWSGFKQKGM